MTLKGSHELIDALLYLKISGSLVVASTEVSGCVCVCVCIRAGLLGRLALSVCLDYACARGCVCRNVCPDLLSTLSPSLFVVGEENPQSLCGCRKSDVNRE